MCLSRIYTDAETDDNCIMEEAARVEKHGDAVEVRDLFGEEKHVHGYSVDTVDLMKNFVLLKNDEKPEKHKHSHEHSHDSTAGRLEILLPHLLDHNRSHMRDIQKWKDAAEKEGLQEAAEELDTVLSLYREAGAHFEKAISNLPDENG